MSNPANALTVSEYMRQPVNLARFTDLLGKEGQSYVQSVLLAVANSDELMKCTPQSIMRSALRAASLGLSCDPALKQAWMVPYNKKVKSQQGDKWVKEAQFQPHYKGLYTLAMRTGKYWTINVSPVYEGQRVLENALTGLHAVVEENGFVGQPKSYNPGMVDVTSRRRRDMRVIGWIGYFKTKKGAEKSVYMSVAEIEDHAMKYVKDYEKNPNWNDPEKRSAMEMKTVLRQLLSWADLSGAESVSLMDALQADTAPETAEEIVDAPVTDLQPMDIDEARKAIGVINGKEKALGNCSVDELNFIYANSLKSGVVESARLILKEDFGMEPPQAEKKSVEQMQKELGF